MLFTLIIIGLSGNMFMNIINIGYCFIIWLSGYIIGYIRLDYDWPTIRNIGYWYPDIYIIVSICTNNWYVFIDSIWFNSINWFYWIIGLLWLLLI